MRFPSMVRRQDGHASVTNPVHAMLLSMLIPGLGSIRNGDLWKGLGILAGFLVSIPLTVVLLGMITLPAFWFVGMVDAYEGARKWNVGYAYRG